MDEGAAERAGGWAKQADRQTSQVRKQVERQEAGKRGRKRQDSHRISKQNEPERGRKHVPTARTKTKRRMKVEEKAGAQAQETAPFRV
jgi:hypothetical protein